MKAGGLLLKFLKTCPPKMEVGITVVSKGDTAMIAVGEWNFEVQK